MNNNYLQPSINSTVNTHLKGNPTAPTQPAGTSNTTIANTKFVTDLITPIIWAPAGGGMHPLLKKLMHYCKQEIFHPLYI